MSAEDIQFKLKSYSHQEYNQPHFTDFAKIRERLAKCLDPFDRPRRLKRVQKDESFPLPEWLIQAAGDGRLPRSWLTGTYDV